MGWTTWSPGPKQINWLIYHHWCTNKWVYLLRWHMVNQSNPKKAKNQAVSGYKPPSDQQSMGSSHIDHIIKSTIFMFNDPGQIMEIMQDQWVIMMDLNGSTAHWCKLSSWWTSSLQWWWEHEEPEPQHIIAIITMGISASIRGIINNNQDFIVLFKVASSGMTQLYRLCLGWFRKRYCPPQHLVRCMESLWGNSPSLADQV